MGIIVLSLAVLPLLGIGGMQLFVAEVPGPTPDKLHPRIKGTAKRLWFIYMAFTLLETLLLWLGDMNLFDAINHSFTTMATGGYSTKQASIAYWDSPYIHYIIGFFMIIAGTNFTLSYFALHLNFKKVLRNEEFRFYLFFILIFYPDYCDYHALHHGCWYGTVFPRLLLPGRFDNDHYRLCNFRLYGLDTCPGDTYICSDVFWRLGRIHRRRG